MEDAEQKKAEGNEHLAAKRYADAIQSYSGAIALWPSNAVYYSNRAAAYTLIQVRFPRPPTAALLRCAATLFAVTLGAAFAGPRCMIWRSRTVRRRLR